MLASNKPFGLINLGNTCYMNTVLQTLFLCKDFNNDILMAGPKLKQGSLLNSYKTIIRRMIESSKQKSSVKKLKLTNFIDNFREQFAHVSFNQQDAHEAMFYLLSKYHEALKENFTNKVLINTIRNMRYNKKIKNECARQIKTMYKEDYSIINEYFYGQWCSIIHCSKCNHKVNRVEVFKGFSLEIQNIKKLNDAINEHMKQEELDGYKCDNCGEKDCCLKSHVLLNTPQYLFVQLKRFNFDWNKQRFLKTSHKVDFEEFLHFKEHLLHNNENKNVDKVDLYKLSSVINHVGNVNGGHYYSFHKFKDSWVKCDDDNVSFINERQVYSQNAYILLYEKVSIE
jgi:ubiquitin C-terminal hydrolase